jgi:hypothetical protein
MIKYNHKNKKGGKSELAVDSLRKHILAYLSAREQSPCGLNNIFDALSDLAEEAALEAELNRLKEEGCAEFLWACGSDAQIVITDKGMAYLNQPE